MQSTTRNSEWLKLKQQNQQADKQTDSRLLFQKSSFQLRTQFFSKILVYYFLIICGANPVEMFKNAALIVRIAI